MKLQIGQETLITTIWYLFSYLFIPKPCGTCPSLLSSDIIVTSLYQWTLTTVVNKRNIFTFLPLTIASVCSRWMKCYSSSRICPAAACTRMSSVGRRLMARRWCFSRRTTSWRRWTSNLVLLSRSVLVSTHWRTSWARNHWLCPCATYSGVVLSTLCLFRHKHVSWRRSICRNSPVVRCDRIGPLTAS